jgi:phytoene dehydrogenase-like protein
MHSTIIIGAGHNALAAAFYLAKAGRRPLVLERQPFVGGGAVTSEIHPGFRCPRLSHEVLLDEQIVRDMDLRRLGIEFIPSSSRVCALAPDGPALVLHEDVARSVESLRALSAKDAEAYSAFRAAIDCVASVIGATFDTPPPDIDEPSATDLWNLLKTGQRFRSLGKRNLYRLLRWLPMPVGDLLSEWFESDLLRAALAGPGVSGTMLGPRSAGSALVLLLREASRRRAGGHSLRVRGGPGALTRAMAEAATSAGAEIRTNVTVERILVRNEQVVGVVSDGQEIASATVLSGVDPKTTFLSLVDAVDLAPGFLGWMRNYRASGTVAKVNMALASLPTFRGVTDPAALSGRVHVGPDLDYLEQAFDHAKYGEVSAAPWLDITIPSILDTELTPRGAHVASIYVHYAPYALRDGNWPMAKDMLLASTVRILDASAPGIRSTIVGAEVVTPADIQSECGLSGGHIFHGELALDQLFTMRPLLGHAGYDTPVRGLFLCGAGTHPGGFMTGTSGRLGARALLRRSRQG